MPHISVYLGHPQKAKPVHEQRAPSPTGLFNVPSGAHFSPFPHLLTLPCSSLGTQSAVSKIPLVLHVSAPAQTHTSPQDPASPDALPGVAFVFYTPLPLSHEGSEVFSQLLAAEAFLHFLKLLHRTLLSRQSHSRDNKQIQNPCRQPPDRLVSFLMISSSTPSQPPLRMHPSQTLSLPVSGPYPAHQFQGSSSWITIPSLARLPLPVPQL